MAHATAPSPPPVTYTGKSQAAGPRIHCKRCGREHPYPQAGSKPIRCECGWWYRNVGGEIVEEFRPRIGST